MNMQALEPGIAPYYANASVSALAKGRFTQDEISSLLRLRQWHQNGASDRVNVVRQWEFLKFLIMHGKLKV